MLNWLVYCLVRIVTFPLAYMPYSWLWKLGALLAPAAYYLFPRWRKIALSNIALALSREDPVQLTKACFKSLIITFLEYPKLGREKEISRIAYCENPDQALELMQQGKGVIFLCGHQANWELLFLEGTSRMPGVAIGRPIKNPYLYRWIRSIREKWGGKIVMPKEAVKEGLRALYQGKFLGIVGDQGMPESGFCSPFLGRLAWTSPLPALLAVRSGAPLIVAGVAREKTRYRIHYYTPLFANPDASPEQETRRLMHAALALFEQSILSHPDQWLWIHNRWKQQPLSKLKKAYRHDCLAVVLPKDPQLLKQIGAFRVLYPTELMILFIPHELLALCPLSGVQLVGYTSPKELFRKDYRFKLLFNFTDLRTLDRHYQKLSVMTTVHLSDLHPGTTLLEQLQKTLCPTTATS